MRLRLTSVRKRVLDQIEAHERSGEREVRGQARGRGLARLELVVLVVVEYAGRVAHRPPSHQAGRPAAGDFRRLAETRYSAMLFARVVLGIQPVILGGADPGGPARVERVEGPLQGERLAVAVVIVGVRIRDQARVPIRLFSAILNAVPLRSTSEVYESPRVIPVPARLSSLIEKRPLFSPPSRLRLTPRSSDQVSRVFTSMSATPSRYATRLDGRFVQVMRCAQQALGLLDGLHRDRVALLEEQEPPDHLRAGRDVELVREAEEPVVLQRVGEVEDVLGDDPDLADARARRLELGERRNVRGLGGGSCALAAGPAAARAARQTSKAMPNQRDRPGPAWRRTNAGCGMR